jgi:Fur family transcriptional regulator, ferric uptake regulator
LHPIGYIRVRYLVMNTIAKISVPATQMAERETADIPPSGEAGSDGWAQDLLRAAGLPLSRPRRLVLEALRGRDRPVTAQDLRWELKLRCRASSAARAAPGLTTVYRILALLAARNLVHRFYRDGQTAYRLCPPRRHDHLLCRCCGRVQEYVGGQTQEWVNRLVAEEGFAADDYQTEVVGLCATCRPGPDAQSPLAACPAPGKHHRHSPRSAMAAGDQLPSASECPPSRSGRYPTQL